MEISDCAFDEEDSSSSQSGQEWSSGQGGHDQQQGPSVSNPSSPAIHIHTKRKRERLIQRMRQFSSSGLLGGSSNSAATASEAQSAASSAVFAEAGSTGCIGGGAGCTGAVAGSTNVGAASIVGGRARLRSKDGSLDSTDSGVSSLRRFLSSTSTDSNDSSIATTSRTTSDHHDFARQTFRSISHQDGDVKKKSLEFRILVLGPSRSGKTAIISQFLYDCFQIEYSETVDEMYRGEFDTESCRIALNIEDTGGSYFQEFRTMAEISAAATDAFILVYSAVEPDSFQELTQLVELVHRLRGEDIPIVVVANKSDLGPQLHREEFQAVVTLDWNHGFVEASARNNVNISNIFKELLRQAEIHKKLPDQNSKLFSCSHMSMLKRRSSMPQVPKFYLGDSSHSNEKFSIRRKKQISEDLLRKDSCTIS